MTVSFDCRAVELEVAEERVINSAPSPVKAA
jgi:hypothetical protein